MKTKAVNHDDLYGPLNDFYERLKFAEYTVYVLIPQLQRLAVPWTFFKWRKLEKEIYRRNEHVRWYSNAKL